MSCEVLPLISIPACSRSSRTRLSGFASPSRYIRAAPARSLHIEPATWDCDPLEFLMPIVTTLRVMHQFRLHHVVLPRLEHRIPARDEKLPLADEPIIVAEFPDVVAVSLE